MRSFSSFMGNEQSPFLLSTPTSVQLCLPTSNNIIVIFLYYIHKTNNKIRRRKNKILQIKSRKRVLKNLFLFWILGRQNACTYYKSLKRELNRLNFQRRKKEEVIESSPSVWTGLKFKKKKKKPTSEKSWMNASFSFSTMLSSFWRTLMNCNNEKKKNLIRQSF